VREMGQSAWLNTLLRTLQGAERRVNASETEIGCNDWISWSNHYSVLTGSGRGETNLWAEEARSRFVSFPATISLRGCYRSSSTLTLGSLPR
jgi:hypothetical protein